MRHNIFAETYSARVVTAVIWFCFTALSLYIAPFHEVWADEVQAFLIARDASLEEIITDIPHQEGQPVLWHLLLKGLIAIFGDGLNITYVSVAVMSVTVGIFLFCCRVPLIYKILLPFGHYFFYQYNIISRNYCLAYLALVLLAVLYDKRHKQIWGYALTLLLLAESTAFLAPTAAVLGLFWFSEAYRQALKKPLKYIAPMCLLGGCGLLMLWQILPVNMVQYSMRIEHIENYPYNVLAHFPEAFFAGKSTALNLTFLFVIAFYAIRKAMSSSFYANVRSNLPAVLRFTAVWAVFGAVYLAVRPMYYHQGLIWGLFLCSVYMFFPDYAQSRKHYLFLACAVMQIYWSFVSVRYDIKYPYSSQHQVLEILKKHSFSDGKIQAIGFHTLPLQAILGRDKLYIADKAPMYWLWTEEDMDVKGDNMQELIDCHHDIAVIDEDDAAGADFSYYENQAEFNGYKIPAAAVYKGYLFYEQGVRLFIRKTGTGSKVKLDMVKRKPGEDISN